VRCNAPHLRAHECLGPLTQPFFRAGDEASGVEGDCRPTRAYLQDDGTWKAMVDGRWAPAEGRLLDGPTRATADQDNPWAEGWNRSSIDELRDDLEGFLKR